jgi:hypothetical protein
VTSAMDSVNAQKKVGLDTHPVEREGMPDEDSFRR